MVLIETYRKFVLYLYSLLWISMPALPCFAALYRSVDLLSVYDTPVMYENKRPGCHTTAFCWDSFRSSRKGKAFSIGELGER